MTRRLSVLADAVGWVLPLALALLCVAFLAACGKKGEPAPGAAGGAAAQPLRLMLDYFPNADHAGIYAAQESGAYAQAGLDVEITPPPDPSAPLKLLLAGKVDVAISYEPELLLARDEGAELVSVGALVQGPLTSLMAVGKDAPRTPQELRGKRVGTAGLPYQSAYLRTILETAGVDPGAVKETNVGFNLVPAMLSGKVDATLGAFWNYEGVDLDRRGRDPQIQRMERLGVPTYDELIFVVRRRDLDERFGARVRRFLQATARGHALLREDPAPGIDGLLAADPGLDRGLQEAAVRATLPVFFPADEARPFGYQDPEKWQAYIDWMADEGLIRQRQDVEQVLTNEFLAGEGLDPRSALEQD
jgi:putative hydroxymethylpyrimidine transport system substrate-binding protein